MRRAPGQGALAYLQQLESTVNRAASTFKSSPQELQGRITQVLDQVKSLEKEIAALKGKLASSQGDELLLLGVDVKGIKVLAAKLEGADTKTLRDTMDKLKDKLKTAVIVLAAVDGDKVQITAGVTADSVGKVKAGELVNFVAQQVGGKGGGKADMAMAGGTEPGKLAGERWPAVWPPPSVRPPHQCLAATPQIHRHPFAPLCPPIEHRPANAWLPRVTGCHPLGAPESR